MNRTTVCCKILVVSLIVLSVGRAGWAMQRPEERPLGVSLIRVIANPEKFDGHRLRVIGFLAYGGGLDQALCLYVSETDARNSVVPNCIFVDQSFDRTDKRLGKYVILNATFHYVGGHGVEYLSFKEVSDIKLWPPVVEK